MWASFSMIYEIYFSIYINAGVLDNQEKLKEV